MPLAQELLCLTDCEPLGISEMLTLCPELEEALKCDRMDYLSQRWEERLCAQIAGLYVGVTPAQVRVHHGAGEALLDLMRGILSPHDRVIAHAPAFPPIHSIPSSLGCEVIQWRADPENGWKLDLELLAKNLGPRTRLVIVNFPHNPTGYVPSHGEFQELIELVRRHGTFLMCDEVYHGLRSSASGPALPLVADVYEHGISVGSLSKAFGLPGVRVGWLATRSPAILASLSRRRDAHVVNDNMLGHIMACSALTHAHAILSRNQGIVDENRELFARFLDVHGERVSCHLPMAGPVAFPALRRAESSAVLCDRLLAKTGALLVPSAALQFGDRHFRIGLGRKSFRGGLDKLSRFLHDNPVL